MSEPHNTARRPRVLMLAYCCSPYWGSEPGMGWNFATQIARYCDTWIICEEKKFAADIRKYIAEHGPIPGLQFIFVPERFWAHYAWKVPGVGYLSYNLWHRRVFQMARRLHEQVAFDLTHQLNFIGFREPGYLGRLDVPWIWGPIGGTQNYPASFLTEADWAGGCGERLRAHMNRRQLHGSRRVAWAMHRADAVLTANSTNYQDVRQTFGIEPLPMLETGLRHIDETPRAMRSADEPLRILWSGGFKTWKALHLLLQALARLPSEVRYRVEILGDGRLRRSWQRLAHELKISQHLHWHGEIPHQQALKMYRQVDVCAFTSLRDTSGNVVLESLAAGVPVVCLDHQGVRDMVTESCGIKIPVTNPEEVIRGIRNALVQLATDRELLEQLSEGALQRAQYYSWSRQSQRMLAVYRQVLERRCPQENFLWEEAKPRIAPDRHPVSPSPSLA